MNRLDPYLTSLAMWLVGYGLGCLSSALPGTGGLFAYVFIGVCFILALLVSPRISHPLSMGRLLFCLALPAGFVVDAVTREPRPGNAPAQSVAALPYGSHDLMVFVVGLVAGVTILQILTYTRE